MKDVEKNENSAEEMTAPKKNNVSRRELLKKYGVYTAPTLVSLVLSSDAYAMNGGVVYSTLAECQAAHSGMQMTNGHCTSVMAMHL